MTWDLTAMVISYDQKGACDAENYLKVVTSQLVTTFHSKHSSWLGQHWLSFTLERKPSIWFKLPNYTSLSNRLSVHLATFYVSA